MRRILFLYLMVFSLVWSTKASELGLSDTFLVKRNDLPALLKSRNYSGITNFINQHSALDYLDKLKSYSDNLMLDSIVVSEWSEETGKVEKSYLYTCDITNEGRSVLVRIYYWDAEKSKWKINDENYYEFDENGKLKQVEFQMYFLPTYLWYTRIDYEYENDLLKFESRYDRIDEIEFWDAIEQIEYIYNTDNSLKTVNQNKWDNFENDWITSAYSSFVYDSLGNLASETGFDYNFYDVVSTKKFELQYTYDNNNSLIEIVKYVPGQEEGVFEEERKQENIYDASLELRSEIFYNWDFDLKIWNKHMKMLYSNETQGIRLFEESSYLWSDEETVWEGNNKVEYLSENNYVSEDIQNWEFLEVYMPAYSFDGVVCDKIEYANWENDAWIYSSTTNYYFSSAPIVGIEPPKNVEISLYPNPVLNFLSIKTNNLFETTCTIRDLNGRIILQTNFQNNTQIDLSYLNPGIYIVELYSESERIYMDKMIKN